MVKNFERRSRSVLAGKRATLSSDSGSKTNEENYSVPPHPPLPPRVSVSDESDRSESLRIATSLLDTSSIERLLKVAQALSSRRRDPVADGGGGGGGDCEEEIQRRTCTARPHRETQSRSEDSLRSIKIRKDDETKLISPTEFRTPTPTRFVKSPSSTSIHLVIFSRDSKNEPEANATDSETRQLENTDSNGHPTDSVAPQTTAATPKSFGPERQSSKTAPGRPIDPRSGDETADGLCRGYSSQRRHGRKASLGTTDITRLIPTLVSENEGFRDREYQRKISLPSSFNAGAAQNLTL